MRHEICCCTHTHTTNAIDARTRPPACETRFKRSLALDGGFPLLWLLTTPYYCLILRYTPPLCNPYCSHLAEEIWNRLELN